MIKALTLDSESLVRTILMELRLTWLLIADVIYDLVRFYSFGRTPSKLDRERLRALVISLYHVLEKGLAMPQRKPVFGVEAASRLMSEIDRWIRRGYGDDLQVSTAIGVLQHYANSQNSRVVEDFLEDSWVASASKSIGHSAGTTILSSALLKELGQGDFEQLSLARRSIRGYSDEPVSKELLAEAVRLAQRSPSVCNRQSSRVYWTNQRLEIDSILSLQSGNRGFGHQAGALIVVTGELRAFEGGQERNQVWVDGGMFAMSLLYAFTYLGLGACALNWSVPVKRDREMRKKLLIPQSQSVIMMIAVGHLRSQNSVTGSQRNSIGEVLFPLELRQTGFSERG